MIENYKTVMVSTFTIFGRVAESASGLWKGECRVLMISLAQVKTILRAHYQHRADGLSSSNRVHTLCNQVISHILVDILQTFHSCHRYIEDVHVSFFWKCSGFFRKIYM
jgi:hypothetical protein